MAARKTRQKPTGAKKQVSGSANPGSGLVIPFLTEDGVVYIWPPTKGDRSLVASHWNAVDTALANRSRAALRRFRDRRVYDSISGTWLLFVDDLETIIAHSDEFDFGPSFYRNRGEVTRFA